MMHRSPAGYGNRHRDLQCGSQIPYGSSSEAYFTMRKFGAFILDRTFASSSRKHLKPSIALFLVLRASNTLKAKPSPSGFSGLQGQLLRGDDYFGDLMRCSLGFPPIA